MTPSRSGITPGQRVRRWAAPLREPTGSARGHRLGAESARIAYFGFLSFFPVFAVLTAAPFLLYRFLPNVSAHRSKWTLLPGATAGMALWMTATLLFRLSLHSFTRSGTVYGVMSGVIAIQIWIYLAALGVLLGAEVAAALERGFGRGDGPARETPRSSETHEHSEPSRLQKENP